MPKTPPYIPGVSIVRGEPMPVVDLGSLLQGAPLDRPRRLISLKLGARRAGLLASDVFGLRPAASVAVEKLPRLLEACSAELIAGLARLDEELLTVLKLGSLIPDEVWGRLQEARS